MLKLNPYAKTARRHAILKHDPEVGTETAPAGRNSFSLYLLVETKIHIVLPIDQG